MALSDKALGLLKRIYACGYLYPPRSREALVDEDPEEALEYLLQEIVDHLYPERWNRHRQSSPLYMVMESAIGGLNQERQERPKTKRAVKTG